MTIAFICPSCGKEHRVGDAQAGRQAKCNCGTLLLIPGAPAPPAAPPSPPAIDPVLSAELGGPVPQPQPVPSMTPQYPAPAPSYPAPGYPAAPLGQAPAGWGASSPARAAKAENALRNLVALAAISYGAYHTYLLGLAIYARPSYAYLFLRILPLLLACLALLGVGFVILMRVRGSGMWGFVVGLVVIGLTSLDLLLSFIDIVRFGMHVGPGGLAGETFINFLFSALIRLAIPIVITWWSRVLNYEPRW